MINTEFCIDLPLHVVMPRKTKEDKKLALNLNVYRNLNFIVNNQAKHIFKDIVGPGIQGLRFTRPIEIIYKIFYPSKRLADISNVCCIVDKFFSDCMVECDVIPDDNYNHLKKVTYRFGGIDKDNPRVQTQVKHFVDTDQMEFNKLMGR